MMVADSLLAVEIDDLCLFGLGSLIECWPDILCYPLVLEEAVFVALQLQLHLFR